MLSDVFVVFFTTVRLSKSELGDTKRQRPD